MARGSASGRQERREERGVVLVGGKRELNGEGKC